MVASISLAYKNKVLLDQLNIRGDYIAKGNFDGIEKVEHNLNQIIQEDIEDNDIDLSKPVKAFITFKTQEGFERCRKYLFKSLLTGSDNNDYAGDQEDKMILGQEVIMR